MWERPEAIKMCSFLERYLSPLGVHIALGGSILYRGTSEHDVDIIVYPHHVPTATFSQIHQVFQLLIHLGFTYKKEEDTTPSTTDKPVYQLYTPKGKKRVDFFFIGFNDRKPTDGLDEDIPF